MRVWWRTQWAIDMISTKIIAFPLSATVIGCDRCNPTKNSYIQLLRTFRWPLLTESFIRACVHLSSWHVDIIFCDAFQNFQRIRRNQWRFCDSFWLKLFYFTLFTFIQKKSLHFFFSLHLNYRFVL